MSKAKTHANRRLNWRNLDEEQARCKSSAGLSHDLAKTLSTSLKPRDQMNMVNEPIQLIIYRLIITSVLLDWIIKFLTSTRVD